METPFEAPAREETVQTATPSPGRYVTKEDLSKILEAVKSMETRVFSRLSGQMLEAARERRSAEAAVVEDPNEAWQGSRAAAGFGPGNDEMDAGYGERRHTRRGGPESRFPGGRRQRERTPEKELDLPGGRGVRKKRWHLAPKCRPYREQGQTKMCDGCDLSLQRHTVSASCPRCTSRYHQECLTYFRKKTS